MSILVVYAAQPNFPATDQNPAASRAHIGNLWVDYTGSVPVQADVDAFFAPGLADAARIAAIKLNARRAALITAFQNDDDVQLLAAVAARYPTLAGDALKAVQDIALVMAAVIRS